MFTIKHITLSDQEFLYESEAVRFEPEGLSNGCGPGSSGPSSPAVAINSGVSEIKLHGGTVFVMNTSGKTVSRYDLGASNVGIIGDGLSDPRPRGTVRT